MKKLIAYLFSILFFIALLSLDESFVTNWVALDTSYALLAQNNQRTEDNYGSFQSLSPNCRANWFQGLLAQDQGEKSTRDAAWRSALKCDPYYIHMMHIQAPDESHLARYAVQVHPEEAESWFWLAELEYAVLKGDSADELNSQERLSAIENFKMGLKLDPTDGLRWRELGDLLFTDEPEEAIEAYLQSCFNGDPGYNGCWLAGQSAEQVGDVEKAIQYYRYSRWKGALNRADELESQKNPHK